MLIAFFFLQYLKGSDFRSISGRQVWLPPPPLSVVIRSPEEGASLASNSVVNIELEVNRDSLKRIIAVVFYENELGVRRRATELRRALFDGPITVGLNMATVKLPIYIDMPDGTYTLIVKVKDAEGNIAEVRRGIRVGYAGFTQPGSPQHGYGLEDLEAIPPEGPMRSETKPLTFEGEATRITGRQIVGPSPTAPWGPSDIPGVLSCFSWTGVDCRGWCPEGQICQDVSSQAGEIPGMPHEPDCKCRPITSVDTCKQQSDCTKGKCPNPGEVCVQKRPGQTPGECGCVRPPQDTPLIQVTSVSEKFRFRGTNYCYCKKVFLVVWGETGPGIPRQFIRQAPYSLLIDRTGFPPLGPRSYIERRSSPSMTISDMSYGFNFVCEVAGNPRLCGPEQRAQGSVYERELVSFHPSVVWREGWLHLSRVPDFVEGQEAEGAEFTSTGAYAYDNPQGLTAPDDYTFWVDANGQAKERPEYIVIKTLQDVLTDGYPSPSHAAMILAPYTRYIITYDEPRSRTPDVFIPRGPPGYQMLWRFKTSVYEYPSGVSYCQYDVSLKHGIRPDPTGEILDTATGIRYRWEPANIKLDSLVCATSH